MKPYILIITECPTEYACSVNGEFVYSIYAESIIDAYEKVKKDEYHPLVNHGPLHIYDINAVFIAEKYGCRVACSITELKEHEGIKYLGGYVE